MYRVRSLMFVTVVTLCGCSASPDLEVAEAGGDDIEAPSLQPRICSPGTSDPLMCKECIGGIMTSYCKSGEFCVSGVCKTDTRSNGAPCTDSGQCKAAYCTDGVCCTVSACAGGCEFCGTAGTCHVGAGVTPKSCSLTADASTCGAPGCYGNPTCSYPGTAKTCVGGCIGDAATGFTYGGSGACDGAKSCKVTAGATSCTDYRCVEGSGCKTSCATDADCLTSAFCDGSVCKPKVSTGSVCKDDRACAAGAGSCKATPTDKRCCTATCASPQVCDSTGTACVGTLPIGSTCTSGAVCATGKCHASGKCTECLGDPDCTIGEFCDAASLKCVPRAGTGDSCTTSASCPSGLKCTEGVCCESADCGPTKTCAGTHKGKCETKNGSSCSVPGDCSSGLCVDGVCCDAACKGQCEACNVAGSVGKCVASTGDPVGPREPCAGLEVELCARASCDGATRESCMSFTSSSKHCRSASCAAGKAVSPANCTGDGSCPAVIETPCGGYACDADGFACRTACGADVHCVEGYTCNGGKCEPKTSTCSTDGSSSVARDGAEKACLPYVCDPSSGNCFDKCAGTSQCGAGFVCDGDKCIASTGDGGDSGGCNYAVRSTTLAPLGLLAVLGALAKRRRR